MPWIETSAVEQREQFVRYWLSGRYSKKGLCERFGISRPTGDKWIGRYEQWGRAGLEDQSRAPWAHPNAVDAQRRDRIVQAKLAHPSWGPKKVLDLLRRQYPDEPWPADSTGGEILSRAGLVKKRRRRRTVPPDPHPFSGCDRPNQVWSVDFKGDFLLGNGKRCYPLTVSDNYSRYLLACRGVPKTHRGAVQPWLERVFQEWGLPYAIRSDNGSPFASTALGGLSRLSKWWVDLGVRPERTRPARPDQNGRHERMHRTLKGWLGESAWSLEAQQQRFDAFIGEYNQERSHESLERQTPDSVYCPSERAYEAVIRPPEYAEHLSVRQVRSEGSIRWRNRLIYLSEVLVGEPVALEACDEGVWNIYYRFHPLGKLDERTMKIVPASGWHGRET